MDEVTSNSCPSSCTTEGDSDNKQVQLYPTMKISCNGRLEGLTVAGVFGRKPTSTDDVGAYPNLQIWRSTSESAIYHRKKSGIEFPSCSIYSPNTSTEEHCTLDSKIPVEMGDIIGIVLPSNNVNQAFRVYFSSAGHGNQTSSYILQTMGTRTVNLSKYRAVKNNRPLIYLNIISDGE